MENVTESKRQRIMRRLSALQSERSSFIPHYRDLSEYILPRQSRFFASDRNKGNRRSEKINDNTATLAVRNLSSGMMGGLTSPSRPWFQLRTPDPATNEVQAVKVWLKTTRDRMAEVFLSSNLYTTLPMVYSDLAVFGTSAFAVLEDDQDVIRCFHFPVGSYMLGASHRGSVDTLYRQFQMTVSQMVGQFGLENCSESVQDMYKRGQMDQWIDVLHVVEPNMDYDPKRLQSKYKAWSSTYLETGRNAGDKFLSEAGFDDFVVMAPRWQLTGEDIYGHSPAMDALGDIKALQLEQKRKMEAIAKQVNPPMTAPQTMRNAAASVLPGAITYVPDGAQGDAFRPAYQVNLQLQHLLLDIQENQRRIKEALFENLFLMLANIQHGQMTAQEVAERQQEKLQMLGPVLERLNDELFDPLIDRVFNVMMKRNLLPPPPAELHGVDLNVEYVSIMSQAAKLSGIAAVQQLVQFVGNLGGAYPDVLDKLESDKSVDVMASMLGAPPELVRDDRSVAQRRQARQQQENQQRMMAMAQQGADTAKTLADTQVTDPSALTAMMAQMRGGA